MCDPNLLAASAANVAQSQQPADLDQQVVAGLLNLYPVRAAAWLPDRQGLADFPDRYVRTVEEFLYRRPHYEHLLQPQMLP